MLSLLACVSVFAPGLQRPKANQDWPGGIGCVLSLHKPCLSFCCARVLVQTEALTASGGFCRGGSTCVFVELHDLTLPLLNLVMGSNVQPPAKGKVCQNITQELFLM